MLQVTSLEQVLQSPFLFKSRPISVKSWATVQFAPFLHVKEEVMQSYPGHDRDPDIIC